MSSSLPGSESYSNELGESSSTPPSNPTVEDGSDQEQPSVDLTQDSPSSVPSHVGEVESRYEYYLEIRR